jgi:hypothetical protein
MKCYFLYRLALKKNLFFILFVLSIIPCYLEAQSTRVRGKVIDKQTHEPLPFVNVLFKGTPSGTITDFKGDYFIETKNPSDSIMVSYLGYFPQCRKVTKNAFQNFDFELESNDIVLDEVVIKPGENPANVLLRKVIANKEHNNPENLPSFSYECYNKMEFDINNIDEKIKNRKLLNQLQFVFNYIDTSVVSGKRFLPFLIIESISDYYFESKPKIQREIIKASKISGVQNQSVAQFTGKLYQDYNIYDNYFNVFDQGLVSPISDQGLLFYKYYLVDSSFIDNTWCYEMSFKPRRKQEPTFTGFIWIADTSYAIKKVQVRIADDANINFVNDMIATVEYSKVNDSIWMPYHQYLFVDFNLTDKTTGFFGRKTTTYKNYKFNKVIPESVKELNTRSVVTEGAMNQNSTYWDSARHIPLTKKESQIYHMVDSIKQVPIYKTFIDIVNLLVAHYYVIGLVEIGPYYTMFSYNPIEGNRFRIGGRTSNKFSTKLMIDGHVAYGTRDGKFKYGGGAMYMFQKNPRMSAGFNFENDVRQLGKSENAFLEDNILSSLLRRNPNNKLTLVYERKAYIEKEWFTGFSNIISFNYKKIIPGENVPFVAPVAGVEGEYRDLPHIITSEISLNTRFAFDEKYLMGEFERVSMGTNYPILNLTLTKGLKNVFGSSYDYFKINMNVSDKISINPIGFLKFKVEGGKIFGMLPYPLLELHKGNETYAFDYFAYNMMNYYEFVSDQYASLFAEQHFQGFFLNHIPLFRKLKWREVASFRGLIGSVENKNKNIMLFPEGLSDVRDPYFESSLGIENIFKFLRVDAMWRLNHLDHPDIQQFGIRAMLQVIF